MITVIIKDSGEPRVVQLTYENIWKEIKDIPKSEIIVSEDWFAPLKDIKNTFVCLVEPDCLVNSGYFTSMLGLIEQNPRFRKMSMLSSSVAVTHWVNRFYGYSLNNGYTDAVVPNREKKSRGLYPIQIGYVPGAIVRMAMLKKFIKDLNRNPGWQDDLVTFSTRLSLEFWQQGDGNPVFVNPNTTYVTTEDYVNNITNIDLNVGELPEVFRREIIS
jgi:hypothetical protein